MAKRNNYTFLELVMSLKREYLKNQELLEELKPLIEIDDSKVVKELKYKLKSSLYDNAAALYLKISKEQKKIEERFNKITEYIVGYNEYKDRRKTANYKLQEEPMEFVNIDFTKDQKSYEPHISIKNIKTFKEILEELKNTKLSKMQSRYINLNAFQIVDIDDDTIDLTTQDDLDNTLSSTIIRYDAKKDKIILLQPKSRNDYIVEQLLETKIPFYELSNEQLEILNNSFYSRENTIIDRKPVYKAKDEIKLK